MSVVKNRGFENPSHSSDCNWRGIVACINSGCYDYIGVAISPWHARMAVASYLKLFSENLVKTGILLIDRHNKDGYLTMPEVIAPGLNIAYLKRETDGPISMVSAIVCRLAIPLIQKNKTSGRSVYIANPSFPGSIFDSIEALTIDCRINYILLDEGVGSYLSSAEDWANQSISDRDLHGVVAFARKWLFIHEQKTLPKLINALKKQNRFGKFYLFKEDGDLNVRNAMLAKKSFELFSNNYDLSFHLINKEYEGAVVFCSQYPLVESNLISLNAYRDAVHAAHEVADKLKVPFVIKLHPREIDRSIYSGFDSFIDSRNGVALEDILGDLSEPPLCITSLCSTAMITASVIFNCRGVYLGALVSNEELSESLSIFCSRLNSLFGDYFIAPSTIDSLCSFLKQN